MKKTTTQRKSASSRGDVSPGKGQNKRSGPRVKRSGRNKVPAEAISDAPEVIVETLEIVERTPEIRRPMPVHLARMLEEETWWRVVPALKREPEKQHSNDRFLPVEYRKAAAKRSSVCAGRSHERRAAAPGAAAKRAVVLEKTASAKKRKASRR